MRRETTQTHWIRRILISIVVLCTVTAILMMVGLSVLNSEWGREFLESKLSESVGQQVTISSFEVDAGRIIRVRIEKASVANPSWASNSYLASVETLDVGIDAMDLLGGDLILMHLQATAPVVHLERSVDGKANWAMGTDVRASSPDQEADRLSKEASSTELPRIESLVITGGRLTYFDPPNDISVSLSFNSRNDGDFNRPGQLIVDGGGQLVGKPVTFGLSVGTDTLQTHLEENPFELAVQINGIQTMLHIEGEVDALLSPDTANLKFHLDGQNLSQWNKVLDMELPALPTYQLAANLKLADGVWLIDPMNTTIGVSDLTGSLRIMPGADPLRIEGELSSKRLDVAQLQGYMPEQQDSDPLAIKVGTFLHSIANAAWQAGLTYRADLITTDAMPIHKATIGMNLKDKKLTIESLSGVVENMGIKVEAQLSAEEQPSQGRVQVRIERKALPEIASAADARNSGMNAKPGFPGTLNGEVAVNIQTTTRSAKKGESSSVANHDDAVHSVDLSTLAMKNFEIRYADPSSSTQLLARMNDNQLSGTIVVRADGEYRNEPVEVLLTVPSVESFLGPHSKGESREQLSADFKLADSTASVSALIEPTWPPMWMDLSFSGNSESPSTIASLFGVELPNISKAALHGSLSKRSHTWSLNDFASVVGESDLSGQATLDTTDGVQFKAKLRSDTLDVASLIPATGKDTTPAHHVTTSPESPELDSFQPPSGETILPSWLTQFNGMIGLQVEKVVLPGTAIKDVSVQTTMDAGLLRIAPLSIDLGGGTIKTTAELNLRQPSLSGTLRTDIQRVDLNEAMQTLGREAPELGKVSGRLALSLPPTDQTTQRSLNADALLDRLHIDEVQLRYDDPDLQAKTDLRLMADNVASGIRVTGTVEYRENPVEVSLTTGSIRQALKDYGSMPVDATFKVNETTIGIQGNVGDLFPVAKFKGTIGMEGPNPARLGDALGIPLPHLPPYRLEALVHREQGTRRQQTFNLNNLEGTIGDSDLAGTLRVTTGGERPMIFARLHTRTLDFDDLAGLIGAPPDPDETASPEQEAQAEAFEKRDTFLPDKPIDFTKLRKLDADVEYRAKDVKASDLPLNDFALDMILEDGHMQVDRLDFGVATGTAAMQLEVNARESPVQAKLHNNFDHINVSQLLARFEVGDNSFGDIGGRATLWMRGESLAQWFASADGGLYFTMTGGKIDALLVELAGLDFTESAAVFLSTDTGVDIECAYTDLQARSGMVTIQPLLVDTTDTKFMGHGTIDLRQEKMNLTVEPFPKDFTILSSRGPLHVSGTFMKPSFSVEPSFPSPEFSTAEDSTRCSGMVEALRNARKDQRVDKQ